MGLFNNWPYVDEHKLNLDWVIKVLKEAVGEWTRYHADMEQWKNDTDTAFQDLKSFVNTYFDNLDVQDEINNKLDEMYVSGELADIIASFFTRYPIGGQFEINNKHIHTFNSKLNPVHDYSYIQGGCMIPDSGNYIFGMTQGSEGNNVLLTEVAWSTNQILRTAVLELQHCNWISYVPETNELLIASTQNADNVRTALLYIVDYSNLTIKETLDLAPLVSDITTHDGMSLWSCSFDLITGKYYLTYYYYTSASNHRWKLYEWDRENNALVKEIVITEFLDEITGGYGQGCLVHNNTIYYLCWSRSCVYTYGIDGLPLKVIEVAVTNGLGIPTKELEQISPMKTSPETDLCVISGGPNVENGWYTHVMVGRINPFQGQHHKSEEFTHVTNKNLYVDYTYTGLIQEGTSEHPFKDIMLALEVEKYGERSHRVIIVSNGSPAIETGPLVIIDNTYINCNNVKITSLKADSDRVVITNATLNDSEDYTVDNKPYIELYGTDFTLSNFTATNNQLLITAYRSQITLFTTYNQTPNLRFNQTGNHLTIMARNNNLSKLKIEGNYLVKIDHSYINNNRNYISYKSIQTSGTLIASYNDSGNTGCATVPLYLLTSLGQYEIEINASYKISLSYDSSSGVISGGVYKNGTLGTIQLHIDLV